MHYESLFAKRDPFALCAACLGLSYTGSSSLINEALFSTAQAIGLQTLIATSAKLFAQKQAMENTAPSNSWFSLSQETKDGIKEGAINTLSTILPALCIPNYCDSNVNVANFIIRTSISFSAMRMLCRTTTYTKIDIVLGLKSRQS